MENAVRYGNCRGRGPDKGFLRSIAGSFILHVIILASALFLYKGPSNYILPSVYTVNLIEPGSGGPKKDTAAAETETLKPQNTEPPAALKKEKPPMAHKAQPRAALKPKAAIDTKDAISIKAAVNKVKEKVKEKEESSLVESRVENLKKKIESARSVDKSIEELRKQIDKDASRGGQARSGMGEGGKGRGSSVEQGTGGGISRGNVESRYKAYYGAIRDRIQEEWIYPEGFDNKKISVVVSVRIARTGKLLDGWVEASSGNPRFDESLLDAVKKASPFPPLPQDFEGNYLETGVRFCHPPCN